MEWIRPRFRQPTKLVSSKSRWKFLFCRNIQCSRSKKSYNHTKRNINNFSHRHNKYFLTVKTLCLSVISVIVTAPVNAETVGGVSATANPIANSSGTVTNQAIQVLQGPYITNQFGDGISCQGPTLNLTPYVARAYSWQHPYEPYYQDPVYDTRDVDGDGIIDNPGNILYHVPTRTGQKGNYNWNGGFSATLSWPLDRQSQKLCKEAAKNHNELRKQLIANKRLDFEIARLKNCGELKKKGIMFHPKSPYYSVCADVIVTNPGGVIPPHKHTIPNATSSAIPSKLDSSHVEDSGVPIKTKP